MDTGGTSVLTWRWFHVSSYEGAACAVVDPLCRAYCQIPSSMLVVASVTLAPPPRRGRVRRPPPVAADHRNSSAALHLIHGGSAVYLRAVCF